jgi:hypothetical protein
MAQTSEKCASMRLYNSKNDAATQQKRAENEVFLQEYIKTHQNKASSRTILTIPVVIHIVHNGEAVGTGVNISEAQAKSQIDVLNKDFRLLNSNKLPSTHPFAPIASDIEIEFCLAAIDPDGKATNGITRYNGGANGWDMDGIENNIKPKTIWNHKKYLNIWSANLIGDDKETLGYATFPGDPETNDKNDGVVIRPQAFGIGGLAGTGDFTDNNRGRTATHEVGHWLNLRHVWGDEKCGDDLVSDTPPQETKSEACPTFPFKANNICGSGANGIMYMNYMDYVDDDCMNMFTNGQKERMIATMNGIRTGLVTTPVACNQNVASAHDLNNAFAVEIYPNPVSNNLTITTPTVSISSIEVFTVLGSHVVANTQINDNQAIINTDALSSGQYFVQIKANGSVVNRKFIKINHD